MKILIIPDLHGKDIVKLLSNYNLETFDKMVFMGDYFDSFTIKPVKQLENFNKILELKEKYEDRIELLIGNHDLHYLNSKFRCAGFDDKFYFSFNQVLMPLYKNKTLKVCVVIDNYLFSHAGISNNWLKRLNIENKSITKNNIDLLINFVFQSSLEFFSFQKPEDSNERYSIYGDNTYQSPLWIRPTSLIKDKVSFIGSENITQVVGHTSIQEIQVKNNIIFTDCLDYKEELLILKTIQ